MGVRTADRPRDRYRDASSVDTTKTPIRVAETGDDPPHDVRYIAWCGLFVHASDVCGSSLKKMFVAGVRLSETLVKGGGFPAGDMRC